MREETDETTSVLSGAAVAGAAAAASTFPAPAISQGRQEWRMGLTWPANTPGLGMRAQNVARRIELFTEGRIRIRVYGAGELMPAFQVFDATAAGDIDMYQGAEYYWQGKHRGFNFFTTAPYGFTPSEHFAWMNYGGGQELWDELAAGFGVKGFLGVSTGTQMLGWFNKEINSIDDFRGLRYRIPGLMGELYRRVGAAVVNIPAAEIFPAMQAGTVDAVEWVGPWADMIFGLHRVAKYFYYPGIHEPGTCGSFGMNLALWESLSDSDKELIETVIQAEVHHGTSEYQARNPGALDEMINKHNIEVRRVSDEVLTELGNHAGEVIRDIAQEDDIGKRIYESYITFREGQIAWTDIAERAFLNARALPYTYT
jgi:TRAP-type mannitol/chloroaromatic compound transport system substrate-binding protein